MPQLYTVTAATGSGALTSTLTVSVSFARTAPANEARVTSELGTSRLTVTWQSVAGATAYNVRLMGAANCSGTPLLSAMNVTGTSHTFPRFSKSRVYYMCVEAIRVANTQTVTFAASNNGNSVDYCKSAMFTNDNLEVSDYLCDATRKGFVLMQPNGVFSVRTNNRNTILRYAPGASSPVGPDYRLGKNANGHLTVYRPPSGNQPTAVPLWNTINAASNVPNLGGSPYFISPFTNNNVAVIQGDCNFVMYSALPGGVAQWNTRTYPNGGTCTNGTGQSIPCICQ